MENQASVDEIIRVVPVGGFSDRPVPRSLIEEILDVARRAPSGVNAQPWKVFVLQGQARANLVESATSAVPGLVGDVLQRTRFWQQFDLQPGTGGWPAQDKQLAGDQFLSDALAASSDNQAQAELARYFRFFDAPVALMFTISRSMGSGSVLDYGMFLQNITLGARARGLHTYVQTGWKGLADRVLTQLGAPQDTLLVCGMALGYSDATQPPFDRRSDVLPVSSFTTWHA